jgi:hypothetical protein
LRSLRQQCGARQSPLGSKQRQTGIGVDLPLMQAYIVHQFNESQSETQRPLGRAQAPVAGAAVILWCLGAAHVGANGAATKAAANTIFVIE